MNLFVFKDGSKNGSFGHSFTLGMWEMRVIKEGMIKITNKNGVMDVLD